MCALDDLAARLEMDPLSFFLKNVDLANKERQSTYREELAIAADLMGWREKWRPRGQNVSTSGSAPPPVTLAWFDAPI
jgi:xanthine dehydrogenase YagR molybdenum-binding subunit